MPTKRRKKSRTQSAKRGRKGAVGAGAAALRESPGAAVIELLAHPPGSREKNLVRLLAAMATEELALAHLINVQAEKAQTVAENIATPFTPEEVIAFQRSLCDVMSEIVKKEDILYKKLRMIVAMWEARNAGYDEEKDDDAYDEKVDDFDEELDEDLDEAVDDDYYWEEDHR